jgi:hypothetical protein
LADDAVPFAFFLPDFGVFGVPFFALPADFLPFAGDLIHKKK